MKLELYWVNGRKKIFKSDSSIVLEKSQPWKKFLYLLELLAMAETMALLHFGTPPPPLCYWWLIMKKRGLTLYCSPNTNSRRVQKCNSTERMRVAKSECTPYSLIIGTLIILSVQLLEQLSKRNHHTMEKSMLS